MPEACPHPSWRRGLKRDQKCEGGRDSSHRAILSGIVIIDGANGTSLPDRGEFCPLVDAALRPEDLCVGDRGGDNVASEPTGAKNSRPCWAAVRKPRSGWAAGLRA